MAYRYIPERNAEALFDECLDEGGDITIAGISFSRSTILKDLDPIAYGCALADFLDAEGLTTDEAETDEEGEE